MKLRLVLATLFAMFAAPAFAQDGPAAVAQSFAAYKQALIDGDGAKASTLTSADTHAYLKQTLDRALTMQAGDLQTLPLLDAIAAGRHDAVFGGARRDEDKARAKERILSLRDEFGQWDPRNQRPELWSLYNGRHTVGQHVRAFPISNWTELDVWRYIARERIALPPLYFAHEREVYARDGMWLAVSDVSAPRAGETVERRTVRYRTVGDLSCTGAVESEAADLDAIVREVAASTITERGATRADDRLSEAAMEDRKKDGYF